MHRHMAHGMKTFTLKFDRCQLQCFIRYVVYSIAPRMMTASHFGEPRLDETPDFVSFGIHSLNERNHRDESRTEIWIFSSLLMLCNRWLTRLPYSQITLLTTIRRAALSNELIQMDLGEALDTNIAWHEPCLPGLDCARIIETYLLINEPNPCPLVDGLWQLRDDKIISHLSKPISQT